MAKKDPSKFQDAKMVASKDIEYRTQLEDYINKGKGSNFEKMENFAKYVPRTSLARFLCKYDMFKQILDVQGSVIECGVLYGGGLMTWAQVSSILEPMNHQRKVIGFDTFTGFPSIAKQDMASRTSELVAKGGLAIESFEDIKRCIQIFDIYRPLGHIEKVRLVKGDVKKTIPQFIKDNPHTIVSLLYLDFDIYEPTVVALEHFLPRIPKGGIIAFDELNSESFPGETVALMEKVGINNLRIQRCLFGTSISYVVIE
jgi:hypothetical protein